MNRRAFLTATIGVIAGVVPKHAPNYAGIDLANGPDAFALSFFNNGVLTANEVRLREAISGFEDEIARIYNVPAHLLGGPRG
jgi:hypothetical protein